jgi:hypothetical protein
MVSAGFGKSKFQDFSVLLRTRGNPDYYSAVT